MEEVFLYAMQYNGTDNYIPQVDNGERFLSIYQGIYQHEATRGTSIYPVLKFLGNVNITRRIFCKGAKHPRKIVRQDGDTLYLFNYHSEDGPYTRLDVLFRNFGYNDTLLHDVQTAVLTASTNRSIKTNNHHRIGGEEDGIVQF
jgi:hypothetical protein